MTNNINADLFRIAYSAVSDDAYHRHYLHGVLIEKHPERGAVLVSTDGHRMVVVHDPDAEVSDTAIVKLPKYALAQCVSKRGKGLGITKRVMDIDIAAKSATILERKEGNGGSITTDAIVTCHRTIIDGTFPDWRKVVPAGEMVSMALSGFNPKVMASVAQFGALIKPTSGGNGAMYFLRPKEQIGDTGGAVVVRFDGVQNVFALIMPMRFGAEPKLPDFFALPRPAVLSEAA